MNASTDTSVAPRTINLSLLHAVALAVIAIGAVYEWINNEDTIRQSVFLFFYAHVAFSLASRAFSGTVAKTWILLILAFALMQAVTFLGHLIPAGQLNTQIEQSPLLEQYVGNFFENIAFMGLNISAAGLLVFVLFMGFNVSARFQLDENSHGMTQRLLGIVATLIIAILTATSLFDGTPATSVGEPFSNWYNLPFIAGMNAIAGDDASVGVVMAMLLVPLLAIFITSARSKGRQLFIWLLLLLCLAGFYGLGYYGGKGDAEQIVLRIQILLACYFSYFLIGPFLTSKDKSAT